MSSVTLIMMMLTTTMMAAGLAFLNLANFSTLMSMTLVAAVFKLSQLSFTSSMFFTSHYLDLMSILLVILTIIISVSSWAAANYFTHYKTMNFVMVWSIALILLLVFSTSSMLSFYFWFEVSLLPIFFLIMGWGYQPERLEASKSMFLYTLFGSLPLLVLILALWKNTGLMLFNNLFLLNQFAAIPELCVLALLLSFLIKFPMYSVHLWLPKAHVEAPVGGSMILAALLLKMGGYGIIRMQLLMPSESMTRLFLFFFCLIGGSLISVLCISQNDMKVLIAYSSVSHMSFAIAGALAQTKIMMWMSVMIMLCHGSTSSALFMGANLMYLRNKTRLLSFNKGLLTIMPQFTMMWALMCVSNMAGPPSINLFSELIAIIAIMSSSILSSPPIALIGFFGAAYTLILYSATQNLKPTNLVPSDLNSQENEVTSFFIYIHMSYILTLMFFSMSEML